MTARALAPTSTDNPTVFLQDRLEDGGISPQSPVPFFVLRYAAESIVFPEMQWSCAGDLLTVLAQIERERRRILALSQLHLDTDEVNSSTQYATTRPGRLRPVLKLAPWDRETLEWIVNKDRSTRIRYRIIVLHICNRHLVYTRARPKESAAVAGLLNRYFPAPADSERRARELAMHSDLSADEVRERDDFRQGAITFIKNAAEWDERRRKYYATINPDFDIYQEGEFSSYTRDFEANFHPTFRWWRVVDALNKYIARVHESVRDYEAMFPNGSYVPTLKAES
ncbi:hypothetical protein EXIGLDRAFT_170810 [Exidia glandulosa HHB12029]|uniref:Uncharacterized protein n=1 Tax=Exidia glandulosa HHB12029 TaxID=1314781 RepID=A0A165FAT2_EXIGL|nr:hypothetical protein EXIGLDRAFT_170810 [Exidia glandulosa HHB12029]